MPQVMIRDLGLKGPKFLPYLNQFHVQNQQQIKVLKGQISSRRKPIFGTQMGLKPCPNQAQLGPQFRPQPSPRSGHRRGGSDGCVWAYAPLEGLVKRPEQMAKSSNLIRNPTPNHRWVPKQSLRQVGGFYCLVDQRTQSPNPMRILKSKSREVGDMHVLLEPRLWIQIAIAI